MAALSSVALVHYRVLLAADIASASSEDTAMLQWTAWCWVVNRWSGMGVRPGPITWAWDVVLLLVAMCGFDAQCVAY